MNTKSKSTIGYVWFFFLLTTLAYVFVLTGCGPTAEVLVAESLFKPRNGAAGERGGQGVAGVQGNPGLSIVGPPGPAGSPGVDATPVTVVNLCPGVSNYGTFVEVALLINNKLWAIYSLNGGFMTYLAPGHYTSNGVGSACNFTVQPDNTITH